MQNSVWFTFFANCCLHCRSIPEKSHFIPFCQWHGMISFFCWWILSRWFGRDTIHLALTVILRRQEKSLWGWFRLKSAWNFCGLLGWRRLQKLFDVYYEDLEGWETLRIFLVHQKFFFWLFQERIWHLVRAINLVTT